MNFNWLPNKALSALPIGITTSIYTFISTVSGNKGLPLIEYPLSTLPVCPSVANSSASLTSTSSLNDLLRFLYSVLYITTILEILPLYLDLTDSDLMLDNISIVFLSNPLPIPRSIIGYNVSPKSTSSPTFTIPVTLLELFITLDDIIVVVVANLVPNDACKLPLSSYVCGSSNNATVIYALEL